VEHDLKNDLVCKENVGRTGNQTLVAQAHEMLTQGWRQARP
jgi:hypothetical protein